MLDRILKALLIAAPFLFVINIATFALMHQSGSPDPEGPGDEPGLPSVILPSASDEVSGGDIGIVPAVSETDIPQVVMTSLAGTETAASIDKIASDYHCTGLTVAVIKDGQVAYNYETGFANQKKTRPLNNGTKFRIASLSKVYTSMLGMKLAEDGIIDLDGDVGDVFGYRVRNPHSSNTPITMRMLLTHTSSFRDRSPYIFSGDIRYDIHDRESYFARKPGTGFSYTNLGMGIAGALIEQASGMQLTEYSNKAFLDGMGIDAGFNGALLKDSANMADCLAGSTVERSAAELAAPHGDKEPGQNHTVAAGGLLISAEDYAKLLTLLINDGTYKGVSYLAPETVAAMHEVQFEYTDFDQCIGIRRSDKVLEGRTVYYHTGAAYGVYSLAIYDTSDKSGVVVFTTGSYATSNDIGIKYSCLRSAEAVYRDLIDPAQTPADN